MERVAHPWLGSVSLKRNGYTRSKIVWHTFLTWIGSQGVRFIHCVERDFLKRLLVACKVTQVIPTHGICVCLPYLFGKLRLVTNEESV